MTDKEIIKALECCDTITPCPEYCPLKHLNECGSLQCFGVLKKSLLDIINRQQAEIERLKVENEKAKTYLANCFDKYEKTKIAKDSLENTLYTARAEAIKECLEWVLSLFNENEFYVTIAKCTIMNKLKEMVGEQE